MDQTVTLIGCKIDEQFRGRELHLPNIAIRFHAALQSERQKTHPGNESCSRHDREFAATRQSEAVHRLLEVDVDRGRQGRREGGGT